MAGLTLAAATAGQQGNTPDQQAAIDQAAALPASPTQPSFTTLSSTNLQPTPAVSLPAPPTPSTAEANGMVAGASATPKSVSDYVSELTPAPTALDNEQQTFLDNIASETAQDANKGADTLAAQQAAGIPDKQQAVIDANNEIATKTANYNAASSALGGVGGISEGKAVLAAQQAGILKAQAADIGISQAKLTAAQGNLSLAQQQVTDAINLKYSTIEANIQTQQAQLAAIAPALDQEQKTQALAQQQVLQDQANAVAAEKDKETQINNIALSAAQAGADSATIAAISNSSDVLSAINAAAPALGAKVANDLKEQAFNNALALRSAANDATRVAIEQENAAISLQQLKDNEANTANAANNAAQEALNNKITTPSGKVYINGDGLSAAAKTAALNAGQVVLSGDQQQSMTAIGNVQTALGSLTASLQSAGVDLTKTTNTPGGITNQGGTSGFINYWAAGSATDAVDSFGTNIKSMVADLQKYPDTGSLVQALQTNTPSGKDSAPTLQTKIQNITQALEDSENNLLINNGQPAQIMLNGQTMTLQADGTYK